MTSGLSRFVGRLRVRIDRRKKREVTAAEGGERVAKVGRGWAKRGGGGIGAKLK